jgi:hypothetical protein
MYAVPGRRLQAVSGAVTVVAALLAALAGAALFAGPAQAGSLGSGKTACGLPGAPDSVLFPQLCYRVFQGVPSTSGRDSTVSRKITIRWVRDRAAESRPDFGGYRIYRTFTTRDTSNMELVRRFAYGDTLLWHFPNEQDTLQFVDPDSTGNLVKVCRRVDNLGRCISPGSS